MQRSGLTAKTLTAAFLTYVLPTTALAGPVYLLQLGSYENLPEARARWADLRNKYPAELKQFSVRFQDVNLPPDNFVVYRTQAGALQERADAERVCEKLSSRGDECYVVETAMFRPDLAASDEPPLSIVNAVAPDGTVQPQSKLPDMAKSAMESHSDVVKEPTMARRIVNPIADVPPPELPSTKTALRAAAPALSELPGMDRPQLSAPSVAVPAVTPLPATPIPAAPVVSASGLKISRPALKQEVAAATPLPATALPKDVPVATAAPTIKTPSLSLPSTPIPPAAVPVAAVPVTPVAPAPISPAPIAVVAPRPITPQIAVPTIQPAPAVEATMPPPPRLSARTVESAVAPSVAVPTSVAPSLVPYPHTTTRPVSAPSATDMSMDDRRIAQTTAQGIVFPDQKRMAPPKPPVAKAPAPKAEKESSFWSAVNPFSSDEQLEKDEIIIEAPEAQSVDSGWVPRSLDPFRDPFASVPEKDANLAKNTMPKSITPRIEQPVSREPVVSGFPPPPMPPSGVAMDAVREQRDAAAARRPAAVPPTPKVAMPLEPSVAAVPVEPVTKAETLNVLKPPALPANIPELKRKAAGADVEVAEAVRVPLSEGRPLPLDQTLSTRLPAAGDLKKMGSPSTKTGEKALWAQIFYFHTQQSALAYWEAFRAKNPSFPPVRVRVTSPLNNPLGQERLVALRVGPFDLADHIKEICDEVSIQAEMKEQEMFCRPVSEVAGSAVAQFDRLRGGALTDRYEQSQVLSGGSSEPMYWVHLGSYPNQAAAKENWTRLLQRHKPVLDSAKPNVSVPVMSSAMEQQYRLRAGPYAMRGGADQLCAKMKASGSDCLVVFSR